MPTEIFCAHNGKKEALNRLAVSLSAFELHLDGDRIYLNFVQIVGIQLPLKSLLKQFEAVNIMLDTDEHPNAMCYGTQVDCQQCQRETRQYIREMHARLHTFCTVPSFGISVRLLLLFLSASFPLRLDELKE